MISLVFFSHIPTFINLYLLELSFLSHVTDLPYMPMHYEDPNIIFHGNTCLYVYLLLKQLQISIMKIALATRQYLSLTEPALGICLSE